MTTSKNIPTQTKLLNTVKHIPVEYFKWGKYPDHFMIDMPHRHNFIELLFFTKGGGMHEIDFNEYEVCTNAIHFIPKSTIHFLNRNTNSDGFTIAFDAGYLEHNNVHRLINPLGEESFILNLGASKFKNILQISKVITTQAKLHEQHYQAKCFLLGLELLINVIAAEKDLTTNNVAHQTDDLQKKFNEMLVQNIHQHTQVKWYAMQLGISAKSLSNHLLKLGLASPKQQIISHLLKSVKKSLINSNRSIKQIALDHNYTEASLCKLFKSKVGYNMMEYKSNKDVNF